MTTVSMSEEPVDEPSSALILTAALIGLSLRRSVWRVVSAVPGACRRGKP